MRRILCSNNVRDTGRLLENVVFLELMRREGDVYVGQSCVLSSWSRPFRRFF